MRIKPNLPYVHEVDLVPLERGALKAYRTWLEENVGKVSRDWDAIWHPHPKDRLVYFFKREVDKMMFLLRFGGK